MPRAKNNRGKAHRGPNKQRKENLFRAPKNFLNEVVSFTDYLPAERVNESTAGNNFFFTLNGFAPYGNTANVPQEKLWNQYAAMYSLYTVRSVKVRWIPYRAYVMQSGGTITDTLFMPSYAIFDSDSSGPVNPPEYMAHSVKVNNVCTIHSGQKEHHRSIDNCAKVLQQVENKQYFETNSLWSNREVIPTAAGLMYHVVSPYSGGTVFLEYGQFIVTYTYAFAQRHEVGENDSVAVDLESADWLKWKQIQEVKQEKVATQPGSARPWTK